MGRIPKDQHDGFYGDVGPVTVTRWKETVVVKKRQVHQRRERSEKQKGASMRFGLLTRFVSLIQDFVRVGFRSTTKKNAQHAAISANMEKGVIGEWPDLTLDYTALRLSEGNLEGLTDCAMEYRDGQIKIRWNALDDSIEDDENRRAKDELEVLVGERMEDKVHLLAYAIEERAAIVCMGIGRRRDGASETALPLEWGTAGMTVVVYVFVESLEGRTSDSQYLGSVKVEGPFAEGYKGKIYKAADSTSKKRVRERKKQALGEEEQAHVSGVRGVVGPIVAYEYKGKPCMKTRHIVSKPPSEKKRKANERFGNLTRFLRSLNDFIRVGYMQASSTMSQLNAAIKANYRGAMIDTAVDYGKVKLSEGDLEGIEWATAQRSSGKVKISWGCAGGNGEDRLMVGIYDEESREGETLKDVARRADGEVELDAGSGGQRHYWLAFVDGDGRHSNSYHVVEA